ncbi:alpha/beta hydrolase [Luteimonas sp. MJ293]|uniref:alpha/beta hydrolase family protein n=1 Tax=Luteimonas sp. MJ146 TaxID=3129240 RepID=UPI0031BA1CD5
MKKLMVVLTVGVLVLLTSKGAAAAGYQRVEVPASGAEPAITAMVWSPCADAPVTAELGPYDVSGSPGCAIEGESLPLVVISHGHMGTLLGHHDTATALADAGFVVVSLNHPGDTFGDDSGAYRVAIFESRPRDVSRVLSFMLEEWPARGQLDAEAVGVFGFSRGGYTALALAGAKPDVTAAGQRLCGRWWSLIMPMCREIRFSAPELKPQADPRIRAAVVVDPLNLFDDAGLQSVRVPVQLWASELGGDGVEFEHIEAIRTALPQAPEYHVAKGAGHFAYLAPCAPRLAETAREICEDPEGFDRAAWHRSMNETVVAFLKRHLLR